MTTCDQTILDFFAIFAACSHGGLVNEYMRRDCGELPRGKHYAVMVDMLDFVKISPCKDHPVV